MKHSSIRYEDSNSSDLFEVLRENHNPISMGRNSVLVPIVYNALMLVGIAARDDGQGGFRSVEVDGLMWHVRFNQDEISFLADDRFLQLVTVTHIHSAFEQVNGGFISLMQVRLGGAGGRDHDQIHRNVFCAGRSFRDADIVRQALA